jgi:hypothetical protein
MIDVTVADDISGDARARSNVKRLAAAQALTGANSAVIFATGSIVGATLAPDISLATVPLSMYVLGELRLVGGQHGGVSAGRARARGVGGGVLCQAPRGVAAGLRISGSKYLIAGLSVLPKKRSFHAVARPSR